MRVCASAITLSGLLRVLWMNSEAGNKFLADFKAMFFLWAGLLSGYRSKFVLFLIVDVKLHLHISVVCGHDV